MTKQSKLVIRQNSFNGHTVSVGLTGDVGYIKITNNNLYPNSHSGSKRKDMNFNTMMIPPMTREQV